MAVQMQGDELLGKNIFQMWEEGAKELEKTALGRLITAPIRLPEKVVTATGKTVEKVPKIVGTVPALLVILALGAGAYLLFMGKSGKKLIN